MAWLLLALRGMHPITAHLAQHGVPLVFANVLLQQIGVPIPAEPTLVVAGSLAAKGLLSPTALVATTVAAALLADIGWFLIGRRYQETVLRLLARLTRSRDGLGRGRETFARWGVKAMLLAKFLPGVSQVLVPVAGATGVRFRSFVFYDVVGTLLWASLPIGSGMVFNQQVDVVLAALSRIGIWLFIGALIAAAGVMAVRRAPVTRPQEAAGTVK
jgi:membrane protein DedA with SNARE-associated domain